MKRVIPVFPTLNHRIEDHQELAHAGNQGNLLRLASSEQTLVEGADDTVMRDGHDGRHVQAAAQVRSSAADATLAAALSRIAIQWSNANELGDLAAGQLSQLGQQRNEQCGGRVADTLGALEQGHKVAVAL